VSLFFPPLVPLVEQPGSHQRKLNYTDIIIGVYVLKHQTDTPSKPILLLRPTDVVGNTEFMNDLQVYFFFFRLGLYGVA
jgi:hypothetical protein